MPSPHTIDSGSPGRGLSMLSDVRSHERAPVGKALGQLSPQTLGNGRPAFFSAHSFYPL